MSNFKTRFVQELTNLNNKYSTFGKKLTKRELIKLYIAWATLDLAVSFIFVYKIGFNYLLWLETFLVFEFGPLGAIASLALPIPWYFRVTTFVLAIGLFVGFHYLKKWRQKKL